VNTFPIRPVDRRQAEAVEILGSKPKFWFSEGDRRFLFKAENRGTGEDWAEVVACHLCRLLGLPHVEYQLAAEYDGHHYIRPGVVCENMAPLPLTLVLGNELLLAVDRQYPKAQRFKVRQHAVEAIVEIVLQLLPPAEPWSEELPSQVRSALDVFVGYVMLDAWIANPDRHHENWGATWNGEAWRLAPTFDHGAGLARNLLDSQREERLKTRDANRTVRAFCERGRSAVYRTAADLRPLGLLETFQAFVQQSPSAGQAWLGRLNVVNRDEISTILESVPDERMSPTCRAFTMELLLTNQQRLLESGVL
jgi:hypothetical protein